MNKEIKFKLNKFSETPDKLKGNESFTVDLCRLYNHYYWDSFGCEPPDPDYLNFEYLRFLSDCADFRFHSNSTSNSEKKRRMSTEIGQAFCRYFLYEFLNITFFAHISNIIDKSNHPAINGMSVKRIESGNTPDYFCCDTSNNTFIAEAKGRFSKVSFDHSHFVDWRKQFERIQVFSPTDESLKVKGFITATQFATESKSNFFSTVFAEDPQTIGEFNLNNDNNIGLERIVKAIHYARVLSKLGLNLYSSSLENGFVVPQEISFNLGVWRCLIPELSDYSFVGGFHSDRNLQFDNLPDGGHRHNVNILDLKTPNPVFIGIELEVMKTLRQIMLGNWTELSDITTIDDGKLRPSNLAWSRDGTIAGSLDFFVLEGAILI